MVLDEEAQLDEQLEQENEAALQAAQSEEEAYLQQIAREQSSDVDLDETETETEAESDLAVRVCALSISLQWSGRTEQLHQQLNRDIVKSIFKLVWK